MRIEELDDDDSSPVDFVIVERDSRNDVSGNDEKKGKKVRRFAVSIVRVDAKRALVGAGGRLLFYPTLIYNVLRNKLQSEFRWWDQIDQFLLLGAVPFPSDVPRLKQLGVGGVVTLNEPFETLVPSSLYHAFGIDHLVIPTRDYLFAPSFLDIKRAVDFIHRNTARGQTTFVHCKAGRGRSTTIVLCYLVVKKNLTPKAAFEYVRSKRPRVRLAPAQWKAVEEFKQQHTAYASMCLSGDGVLITKEDLDGYHSPPRDENKSGKELMIVSRPEKLSPMMLRLSCLFASLKVSGYSGRPISRQLTEARAC